MRLLSKSVLFLGLTLLLLLGHVSSAPYTTSPAKVVSGFFSNAVSAFMKWLWSLKATTKTTISGRPMMKFESGYTVETIFDGSKLGIEPFSVEVLPSGELLILDFVNSNIYRISSSLSTYLRTSPKPRRRTQKLSLTRLKRVEAPVGRRSRPETPLLKWQIEDRVVNVDDEDGGEAAGEEEKKNGGPKGHHRSVKSVSARRLPAGLWRLQLPETVVGGGRQRRRRSRKDLVGFQNIFLDDTLIP